MFALATMLAAAQFSEIDHLAIVALFFMVLFLIFFTGWGTFRR